MYNMYMDTYCIRDVCVCGRRPEVRGAERRRGPGKTERMGPSPAEGAYDPSLAAATTRRAGRAPSIVTDFDLPAIVKAVVTFALTVALSWAATAALRRIPEATHVL